MLSQGIMKRVCAQVTDVYNWKQDPSIENMNEMTIAKDYRYERMHIDKMIWKRVYLKHRKGVSDENQNVRERNKP